MVQTVRPPITPYTFTNALTPVTTTYAYSPTTDLIETDHGANPGYAQLGQPGITKQFYNAQHAVITSTVLSNAVLQPGCLKRRVLPGAGGPCNLNYYWLASANVYDPYGERTGVINGLCPSVDFTPTVSLGACGGLAPASADTHSSTYTTAGDLAQEWTPPIQTTLNGVTTTASVTTTYSYDQDGNKIAEQSANGHTTTYSYDHLGRLVSSTLPTVTDYLGNSITPTESTGYDGEGNVVRQVDGNGDVTQSSFDPLGRLVATADPVQGTTLYTYTATEQTATQDPSGNVSTSSYDAAGRVITSTDPLSGTTSYQYDPAGNTTAITSGTPLSVTQVETRTYDQENAVVSDTVGGPGSPAQTTQTTYDLDGNVIEQQQPNGDVTFNTHDLADRLTFEEIDAAPVNGQTQKTPEAYYYDYANNPIASMIWGATPTP